MKKKEIEYVSPSQTEVMRRYPFYKTASIGGFANGYFKTINRDIKAIHKSKEVITDLWLHKKESEQDVSFFRRLQNLQNFNYSEKIIRTMYSFLVKANKNIDYGKNDTVVVEKFKTNIDNQGHGIESYLNATTDQLLSQGKCFSLTDKPRKENTKDPEPLPFTNIIERNQCMDKLNGNEGFTFFKFKRTIKVLKGYTTTEKGDIVIYTKDIVYTISKKDKNAEWEPVPADNQLGYIPIHSSSLGLESIPLIHASAHFDLDLMNVKSEMRNLLSVQGVNLLSMCQSTWDAIKSNVIEAGSVLVHPDRYDGNAPEWVSQDIGVLDGFQNYIEETIKTLHELASIRRANQQQKQISGKAEKMQFLDTESFLNVLADEQETLFYKITKDWSEFIGVTFDPTIKIDREFDIDTINDMLARIEQALVMELGSTVNLALKRKAIMASVDLSDEQKKQALIDIEHIENSKIKGELT